MKTIEKNPESSVLIRFADCDPLNHLNNARYIDYFMNTREDHLMHFYKLSTYDLAKETGKTWVVNENRIAYLRAAWLMETVVIQSSLIEVSTKGITVEMRMYNSDKTQLKSLLWSKLTHYNMLTKKSDDHDDSIMQLLQKAMVSLPKGMTFEERIATLKQDLVTIPA